MAAGILRLIFVGSLACSAASLAAPVPRSVSTSRQFIVYGGDARLRGAICDLAEQTKENTLRLLHERDDWKTPIVISAQLPQADAPELPPARLLVSQTGLGLKLQLELRMGGEASGQLVERELLRAIYLEMMYRARSDVPVGTPVVQPPDWLLDGTLAWTEARNAAKSAETLATAVAAKTITPLDDFLRQRPSLLESPSRTVYRAYSAALIELLTQGNDGAPRLARFVSHLPESSNDPIADLHTYFPGLGDTSDALAKTWASAVARFAARRHFRILSCEETERELVQLLRIELRNPNHPSVVYTLEEFPSFVANPTARGAVRHLAQRLLIFSARVNPLYRPLVNEYHRLALALARKKTKGLTERLAKLRGTREHITRRMGAIEDYMNWFEATQSKTPSGAFNEYMKAAALAYDQPAPRRRDPISVYLDALEAQLGH